MKRLILILLVTTLTFSAVSQPKARIQAPADPVILSNRESTSKTGALGCTERILNRDGTINWTEYEMVPPHAADLTERDSPLGPKSASSHPQAKTSPPLGLQ